jgi:hypothetical protein
MMKKLSVLVCIFILTAGLAFSAGVENLYTLVVPETFTSLYLQGALGGAPLSNESLDAVEITLGTAPFSFDIDAGGEADYSLRKQEADSLMILNATGSLQLGTSVLGANINANGEFKRYGLDLGGMKGFYGFGGNFMLNPRYPVGGTASVRLRLEPYGQIGVGRMYTIATLKEIELIMRHLGLEPTEERVKAVAEIMYTFRSRMGKYSENEMENYVEYYTAIAEAMGAPERALEIVYIGASQTYAFERTRYNNMQVGWEAGGKLSMLLDIDTSNQFGIGMEFFGDYGTFLMENRLYMLADASLTLSYTSGLLTPLVFGVGVGGTVRYLPEDYHWWIEGMARILFDTGLNPKFRVNLAGEIDYLLTPNFRTYGGLSISNNFGTICAYAGGQYRVW